MTRRSEVGIDLVARDLASREVDRVGGSLRNLGGEAQAAGGHFGVFGKAASGLFNGVLLGTGMLAAQKVAGAISAIPNSVIGMNAELEKSQLQFETLFGGGAAAADRAREHVRMLFDFAKVTPFETGPVINASRILQTFGGDALNTRKNLMMIGDAAAGASADIGDVSFWVGRAYAAIQGGQPFGEARMRLQELALVSPQAAQKMEDMQKAGASAAQVWAVMQGELGRFTGAMGKQAESWTGLTSTLSDTVKLTMADAFKPFFDMAKDGLRSLITLFSDPAFSTGLKAIATNLAAAAQAGISGLKTLWQVSAPVRDVIGGLVGDVSLLWGIFTRTDLATVTGQMQVMGKGWQVIGAAISTLAPIVQNLVSRGMAALQAILPRISAGFDRLVEFIRPIVDQVGTALNPVLRVLADNFNTLAAFIGGYILGPFGTLVQVFGLVASGVSDVGAGLANLQQTALTAVANMVNSLVPLLADLAGKFADWVIASLPGLLANLGTWLTSMGSFFLDHLPDIIGKLAEWGGALIGWVAPRIPGILTALAGFMGRIVGWIIVEGIPKLVGAAVKLAAGLVTAFMNFITGADGGGGWMKRMADFLTGTVIPTIGSFVGGIAKAALDLGGGLVKGFIDGLVSLPGKVADAIRNAFASIKIDIGPFHISSKGVSIDLPKIDLPHFATGAWKLPTDMVAMVHKGEMIVPADIASRLRGETGSGPAAAPPAAAALGGGTSQTVVQNFYFGKDSIRSGDDVQRLAIAINERAQLQGFSGTVRQVGRVAG